LLTINLAIGFGFVVKPSSG